MMQEFHSKHYTADKSVLVGLDIDHATLVALGEKLDLSKGGAGSLPSKYYGGEARQSGGGSHTCIAVIMYFLCILCILCTLYSMEISVKDYCFVFTKFLFP